MRALVVDDARVVRILVKKLLSTIGFEVLEAGDGREALDVLAGQPDVELIVVDRNMPVMDGVEFIRAVRTRASQGVERILMMTAEDETFDGTIAIDAGADGHLCKPFSLDELLVRLRSIRLLPE
jgi:two-component system, chemotaxis family, chemotaxis protein CheY